MKSLPLLLALLMPWPAVAGTVTPGLDAILAGMTAHDQIKVLVVLHEQPDVARLDKSLAERRISRKQRHEAVVTRLQDAARTAQKNLLETLATAKAIGGITAFRPHWIINAIVVTGTADAIRSLAARPDVRIVEPDLQVELITPVAVKPAPPPELLGAGKGLQGLVVPGVKAINADRVWHELGITGAGTLVANMDSGVDGNHPALSGRWRGNFVAAGAAWADVAAVGSPDFPYDGAGHGTHVMGTITGATAFDTLGVAPGAQWIANNAVNASSAEEFDNHIIAGFEWLADPDGNPATTDDVPDVCHNSWGVNPSMGFPACDSAWWSVIDNCEAAGVVVTFSAGNEGPSPGTLRSPGDRASSPTNCFTVGSTSANPGFNVSGFSSRGPSLCGGAYAIKPEVMAPGESIYSCVPGGGYAYMDGTSMAGPHVAGVVALMREAAPDLDVVTIKEILMETAIDLGVAGEDNTYGHGIIDAYAAVTAVLGNVTRVSGLVTEAGSGLPLSGVVIRDLRGAGMTTSGADGSYAFTILAGAATLRYAAFGYGILDVSVELPQGGELPRDITLVPLPTGTVAGTVRGPGGGPVGGATITALGTPVAPVVTAADGTYSLGLPAGENAAYELLAMAPSLAYDLRQLGVQGDRTLDFALPDIQADGFESGGFATLPWEHAGVVPFTVDAGMAYEGTRSARTGSIGHSQATELSLEYYLIAGDEVSFWYKVDSEISYDTLKFYLDGVLRGTWSGSVPWTCYAAYLEAGSHRLTWVYSKDSSISVGSDAAWIDLVSLPGTGRQPLARLTLDATSLGATVDAGGSGSLTLAVGNTGSFGLDYTVTPVVAEPGVPLWLGVTPDNGIVYPSASRNLTVELTPGYMGAGLHHADLVFSSNDPAHPDTAVTVALTVVGVSAVDGVPPGVVQLHGASPNPFNPVTDIQYSLPAPCAVSLRVYDVGGRLVNELVADEQPVGRYRARWDGCDDRGRAVASGIYYARLVAGGTTIVKPMALVR